MMKRRLGWICLWALGVSACSPALDWREVRADGGQVLALFPCKPDVANRASMGLLQCKAEGLSFAMSWAVVPDPAQVAPVLQQMRESMAGKLAAAPAAPQAVQVPGMTPNPQAMSQRLAGGEQQAQVAVFSRGLRVYQLVMVGPRRHDAAWDAFLASVRFAGP